MELIPNIIDLKPAVIGLGYVGLPLAVEMSKHYEVVGFDISKHRVEQLCNGLDVTKEISRHELENAKDLILTANLNELAQSNIYIVTVPTPIDNFKKPDLRPLLAASELIGRCLNKGDIVVYESTVYPGATEEVCIPVLENTSSFIFNQDFFVGYSPERINPGDKDHRVTDIMKVTSGSTSEVANLVDTFYASFIKAGTYLAGSIKIAEAAKVIENTQRDVNIALINELSTLFDKLDIDTHSVLEAAETKWNFLRFVPGLVGGHCIGVDPYYLTHKAMQVGFHPELISAGRRVNDSMPKFVAEKLILSLLKEKLDLKNAKILVLGVTFKENCPDIRNSKVIEVIKILESYGLQVDIVDPEASSSELFNDAGLKLIESPDTDYHGVILAVNHNEFRNYNATYLRSLLIDKGKLYDLKNMLPLEEVDFRL